LTGRFMVEDGREFPCLTVDVSPVGVALKTHTPAPTGERVVAYIDDLGRVEGMVVRQKHNFFALDIHAPSKKRERLARQIAWLAQRAAQGLREKRRETRVEPEQERTLVQNLSGEQFEGELIDVSGIGAALYASILPPIGSVVSLNQIRSRVTRHFEGGFAVVFVRDDEAARPASED
jgi:hypothetical protein